METSEKLKAILCNPDGVICCDGSDEDKRILQEAIKEVELLEKYTFFDYPEEKNLKEQSDEKE